MMPLLIAPENTKLYVEAIHGAEKTRRHLESLGIVPERSVLVLKQTNDSVIVLIGDSRLALDKETALSIMVRC